MRTIRYYVCKISSGIDLKKVASAFRIPAPESWQDSIVLRKKQLAEVYKYKQHTSMIIVYAFGCIGFENFHMSETGEFIDYLRQIIGNPDYKMLARYNELLPVKILKDRSVCLLEESPRTFTSNEGLSTVISLVLAKSVELSRIEDNVSLLMDKSEHFITKLQKGALRAGARPFAKTMANILRFEYESTVRIRIFDKPSEAYRSLALKEAYLELAAYFELEDRYEILEKKVGEVRNITRSYSSLRFWKQERRLILFEVFLLALFPLSYFVHDLLGRFGIEHVFKGLFTNR